MAWELFKHKGSKGSPGVVGSIGSNGSLLIGKELKLSGFDLSLRYSLLWDRESQSIGLKPDGNGYKVVSIGAWQHGIRIYRFCSHYGLTGRYRIARFEREGDIWVLPLTSLDNRCPTTS
jgi:hypothetical protein